MDNRPEKRMDGCRDRARPAPVSSNRAKRTETGVGCDARIKQPSIPQSFNSQVAAPRPTE